MRKIRILSVQPRRGCSPGSPCFFVVKLIIFSLDQKEHCIPSGKLHRPWVDSNSCQRKRAPPTCGSSSQALNDGRTSQPAFEEPWANTEAKGWELLLSQTGVRSWKVSLQQVAILGIDITENLAQKPNLEEDRVQIWFLSVCKAEMVS